MSGWRDFALRGCFRAMRPVGQVAPIEFAKADLRFRVN
jgi:hypothetical protein